MSLRSRCASLDRLCATTLCWVKLNRCRKQIIKRDQYGSTINPNVEPVLYHEHILYLYRCVPTGEVSATIVPNADGPIVLAPTDEAAIDGKDASESSCMCPASLISHEGAVGGPDPNCTVPSKSHKASFDPNDAIGTYLT